MYFSALAGKGYQVMQIGCDPKADSTKNLMKGRRIPTVLEQIKAKGEDPVLDDIVFGGYRNVLCAESGGPKPWVGCAGRSILPTASELLQAARKNHCKRKQQTNGPSHHPSRLSPSAFSKYSDRDFS